MELETHEISKEKIRLSNRHKMGLSNEGYMVERIKELRNRRMDGEKAHK